MINSRVNSHEEKINALRKKYQRNTNNKDLRESCKNQYHKEKTKYQAAIKKRNIESWKKFCNLM